MRQLKALLTFFAFLLSPFAESAFVLKTKDETVLIHLEGKKTKKGDWFKAVNSHGKAKGLIQIKRTGKSKAIAVLKLGTVEKAWPLESTNKTKAQKLVKKAMVKKRKAYLRKIAAYERAVKKRLAEKRRRKRTIKKLERKRIRKLASVNDSSDDTYATDTHEDNSYESDNEGYKSFNEYNSDNMEERVENSFPGYDDTKDPDGVYKQKRKKGDIQILVGALGTGGLNSMKLKSIDTTLSGFGWEGLGFAEINFKNKFALTGFVGYKHFQIGSESMSCGGSNPCFLKIRYIKFGGELKYIFFQDRTFDLWGGIGGSLILPRTVDNYAGLTKKSFDLHGTVGPLLGINFKTGNLVFPMSVQLSLFNPPTETTFSWSVFFKAGCGIKL